jgi:molybdopterin converting factor small subunit
MLLRRLDGVVQRQDRKLLMFRASEDRVDALAPLLADAEPLVRVPADGGALRMAVDHAVARADTPLADGCEVAFFPPVTGG